MIRVNSDPKFRIAMAIAAVKAAHPSGVNGGYYADPVEGVVYFKEWTAPWNPWPDNAVVFELTLLVDPANNCDLSDYVDWKQDYGNLDQYLEMAKAYLLDWSAENSEMPEWVDPREVIQWAREKSPEYALIIDAYEQSAHDAAVSLAMCEIIDEIEIASCCG